jgi:hypothetical protein
VPMRYKVVVLPGRWACSLAPLGPKVEAVCNDLAREGYVLVSSVAEMGGVLLVFARPEDDLARE